MSGEREWLAKSSEPQEKGNHDYAGDMSIVQA